MMEPLNELSPIPASDEASLIPETSGVPLMTVRPWPVLSGDLRGACAENDPDGIVEFLREAEHEQPRWAQKLLLEDMRFARVKLERLLAAVDAGSKILDGYDLVANAAVQRSPSPSTSSPGKTALVLYHANPNSYGIDGGSGGPRASMEESLDAVNRLEAYLRQYSPDLPANVIHDVSTTLAGLHRGLLLRNRELSPTAAPAHRSSAAASPEPHRQLFQAGASTPDVSTNSEAAARQWHSIHADSAANATGSPTDRPLAPHHTLSTCEVLEVGDRASLTERESTERVALLRLSFKERGGIFFAEGCSGALPSAPSAAPYGAVFRDLALGSEAASASRTPFGVAEDFTQFINARVVTAIRIAADITRIESDEAVARREVVRDSRRSFRRLASVGAALTAVAASMQAFVGSMVADEADVRGKIATIEHHRRVEIAAELRLVHAAARAHIARGIHSEQRLEAVAFSERTVRRQLEDVYAAELASARVLAWEKCEADYAATFASPHSIASRSSSRRYSQSPNAASVDASALRRRTGRLASATAGPATSPVLRQPRPVAGVATPRRHQDCEAHEDDEENFVEIVASPAPDQRSPPHDPHERTALEALVDSECHTERVF